MYGFVCSKKICLLLGSQLEPLVNIIIFNQYNNLRLSSCWENSTFLSVFSSSCFFFPLEMNKTNIAGFLAPGMGFCHAHRVLRPIWFSSRVPCDCVHGLFWWSHFGFDVLVSQHRMMCNSVTIWTKFQDPSCGPLCLWVFRVTKCSCSIVVPSPVPVLFGFWVFFFESNE